MTPEQRQAIEARHTASWNDMDAVLDALARCESVTTEAVALAADLLEVVERLQYLSPPDELPSCPECGRGPHVPHDDHCDIGNVIKRAAALAATDTGVSSEP